jgi:VanZ family protein
MEARRETIHRPLFVRFWLPVIAYVVMIAMFSHRERLQVPFKFFEADKVVHAFEYLLLGLLLVRAWRASVSGLGRVPLALIAISCGVFVGTTDEVHQSFVAGRDCSPYDLLADSVGVSVAQVLYRVIWRS